MQPVLELRQLRKQFGGIIALDDFSFSAQAGQIIGIIGANSSGKSSLLDAINGLIALDSGEIIFEKQSLARCSPARRAASGISRSFKQARLFPELSLSEHLYLSRKRRFHPLLETFFRPGVASQERGDRLLHDLKLEAFADMSAKSLSLERQKCLELAMVLMPEPKLILLDELMAGCSNAMLELFQPLLLSSKNSGATILIVEHDFEMLRGLADWLLVMNKGKLLVEGQPEDIFSDEILLKAFFTV